MPLVYEVLPGNTAGTTLRAFLAPIERGYARLAAYGAWIATYPRRRYWLRWGRREAARTIALARDALQSLPLYYYTTRHNDRCMQLAFRDPRGSAWPMY